MHSRRSDYQYTVDGARDFFQDDEFYHHFAKDANRAIAEHPRKKMHVFTVMHYGDDAFMCAVVNDGGGRYHLEDVAFIDVSEYNGRIVTLTDQVERMYTKYGKERTAKLMGLIDPHVRGRFFPIDSRRGNRPIRERDGRSEENSYFEQNGRAVGERHQRSGLSEGSSEVTATPDGTDIDTTTDSAYVTMYVIESNSLIL